MKIINNLIVLREKMNPLINSIEQSKIKDSNHDLYQFAREFTEGAPQRDDISAVIIKAAE